MAPHRLDEQPMLFSRNRLAASFGSCDPLHLTLATAEVAQEQHTLSSSHYIQDATYKTQGRLDRR